MKVSTPVNKRPLAVHATTRSGYAREIVPERVDTKEQAGGAVPVGSVSGRQEGRPSPAERQYRAGVYEQVDAAEATRRMMARLKGKAPPIKSGLDDFNRPPTTKAKKGVARKAPPARAQLAPRQVKSAAPPEPQFDDHVWEAAPEDVVMDGGDQDAFTPGGVTDDREPEKPEDPPTDLGTPDTDREQRSYKAAEAVDPIREYLAGRMRVELALPESTVTLSVIDIAPTTYSVTLLLPFNSETVTFMPKPGSEVVIRCEGHVWPCYYPAAYFEVPQLGLSGLTFIRQSEG